MKKQNRRDFISFAGKASFALALAPIINACDQNALKRRYVVNPNFCTGCGDCLEVCFYNSIDLDPSSFKVIEENCTNCGLCVKFCPDDAFFPYTVPHYTIDESACTECGNCVMYCKPRAIRMTTKRYSIAMKNCTNCDLCQPACEYDAISSYGQLTKHTINDNCVGCGDCVPICGMRVPGSAISYTKTSYSVNDNCKGCTDVCIAACSKNAISLKNGIAHISNSKCDKCGDCLKACKDNAIDSAMLAIDQTKCINCSACIIDACKHNAIERPKTVMQLSINNTLCTACDKCAEVCEYDAVLVEQGSNAITPHIVGEDCDSCGDCLDRCKMNAIISDEAASVPQIDPDKCTKCNVCAVVCEDDAIESKVSTATIDMEECAECGKCQKICPENAISSK